MEPVLPLSKTNSVDTKIRRFEPLLAIILLIIGASFWAGWGADEPTLGSVIVGTWDIEPSLDEAIIIRKGDKPGRIQFCEDGESVCQPASFRGEVPLSTYAVLYRVEGDKLIFGGGTVGTNVAGRTTLGERVWTARHGNQDFVELYETESDVRLVLRRLE